jgi:hypothetical protein
MYQFSQFFTSSELQDIAFNYLNTNSIKRVIDKEDIKSSELKFFPFAEAKFNFQINYSYLKGEVNTTRFDQAMQTYEVAYQQYQNAKAIHMTRVDNAKQGEKFTLQYGAQAPTAPKKPKTKDFIEFNNLVTEFSECKEDLLIPQDNETTSNYELKTLFGYENVKLRMPAEFTEKSSENFDAESSINEECTKIATKIANDKVKKIEHRNLSVTISNNKSTYAKILHPLIEVSFSDQGTTRKIYIDEVNGVISGEKINESDIIFAMLFKHFFLLIIFWYAISTTAELGNFASIILAVIFQISFFVILNKQNKSKKNIKWLGNTLKFFYISEISTIKSKKPTHLLDSYFENFDRSKDYSNFKNECSVQFKNTTYIELK